MGRHFSILDDKYIVVGKYNLCYFGDSIISDDALAKNQEKEFQRNKERFQFLKWGAKAFSNMQIIPPGSGIVHQVKINFRLLKSPNFCPNIFCRLI